MAQAQAAVHEMPDSSEQAPDKSRDRSTIEYPYSGLSDAIEIAKAIHELNGMSATTDQIAAHLQSTPTSGTFRTKMATAKMFRVISGSPGAATLTNIGSRLCDPQQEKLARADAFLAVPLYQAIYEQFKGIALPPAAALEATMGTLGVAAKQRERARQVFQRSAQEAGFFQFGTDRLVMPAIKANAAPVITPAVEPAPEKKKKDEDEDELHPFIKGLLKKLPQPETEWPVEGRTKWLQAAVTIFDLIYTDSDDSRRSITIEAKKDSVR
jgi:hypothetical protein